jgi:site-specific recombinase XerD
MKGARPLTNDEILLVAEQFDGTFALRNRSLFMLGVSVGGRISEMLQLTIGDVFKNAMPVKDLLFQKRIVKGKETARMVPVNADGCQAIASLIQWHHKRFSFLDPSRPLFASRKWGGAGAMTRGQAHKVLEAAFFKAGLNGKLATHSLRKSFAQRIYDAIGDIYLVAELLGHQSIETTKTYLGISYQKMQRAVVMIEVHKVNRNPVLYHSISEIPDDTLLLEAIKRSLIDKEAIRFMRDSVDVTKGDSKIIPIKRAPREATRRDESRGMV